MPPLPAFFDDGCDGQWADAIIHSPCLKVADYRPDQITDGDSTKAPPSPLLGGAPGPGLDGATPANARPGFPNNLLHGAPDSAERQ